MRPSWTGALGALVTGTVADGGEGNRVSRREQGRPLKTLRNGKTVLQSRDRVLLGPSLGSAQLGPRWAQKQLQANCEWQERRGGSKRSLLQAWASQVALPVVEPGVPVSLISALAPGRVTRPCHPGCCGTAAPYARPGSSSRSQGRPHAAPRPPSLMTASP